MLNFEVQPYLTTVNSRDDLHTKCVIGEKQIHLLALVFAQNPEAQFWISLQRITVSKASRQPAWWSLEHSLCAALSNRAHLSFSDQKKQQGKAEYFDNTPKSTGHILSLPHICSFLQIHCSPAETRSHHQSSCVYGAHRKAWTNSKISVRKRSGKKLNPNWNKHSPTYKIS